MDDPKTIQSKLPKVEWNFEDDGHQVWDNNDNDRPKVDVLTKCLSGDHNHRHIFDENNDVDKKLSNKGSLLNVNWSVQGFGRAGSWKYCRSSFIKQKYY